MGIDHEGMEISGEPSVAEKLYDSNFWLTIFNIHPDIELKLLSYKTNSRVSLEKRYTETLTEFGALGIAFPVFDAIARAASTIPPYTNMKEDLKRVRNELLALVGFSEESTWGLFLIGMNPYQMVGVQTEEESLVLHLYFFSHIAFAYYHDNTGSLAESARNDPVAQNFVVDRGWRVAYGRAILYALVHLFDKRKIKTETEEERKGIENAIGLSNQLLEFDKEWWLVEYQKDVKQTDSISAVFEILLVKLSYELDTSWKSNILQLVMKTSGIILPDEVWKQFEDGRSQDPRYSQAAQLTIRTGWSEVSKNLSRRLFLFDWGKNMDISENLVLSLLDKNLQTIQDFQAERFYRFNVYYIGALASTTERYTLIETIEDDLFEKYDAENKKEIDRLSEVGLQTAAVGARKYDSYKYGDYHPWKLDASSQSDKTIRKKKWFGSPFATSLISKDEYEKFDRFLQSYAERMQKKKTGLSPTMAYLSDITQEVNQNRVKRMLSGRSNDDNFFVFIVNDSGALRTIMNLYVLYKKRDDQNTEEWIFNATNLYSKNNPMTFRVAMGTVFSSDIMLKIFQTQELKPIVPTEDSHTFRNYVKDDNISSDRVLLHVMWIIDAISRGWPLVYAINLSTWFGLKYFIENTYYEEEIDSLIPK